MGKTIADALQALPGGFPKHPYEWVVNIHTYEITEYAAYVSLSTLEASPLVRGAAPRGLLKAEEFILTIAKVKGKAVAGVGKSSSHTRIDAALDYQLYREGVHFNSHWSTVPLLAMSSPLPPPS